MTAIFSSPNSRQPEKTEYAPEINPTGYAQLVVSHPQTPQSTPESSFSSVTSRPPPLSAVSLCQPPARVGAPLLQPALNKRALLALLWVLPLP